MADLIAAPIALTPYEASAMRIIQEITDKEGHPPSLQQLANDLGHSTRSAGYRVVTLLTQKGWLRRLPGRRRFNMQIVHRVPEAEELGSMDVKAVGAIAVEAIDNLRRIMGDCGVALDLARRLETALGGGQRAVFRTDGQRQGGLR